MKAYTDLEQSKKLSEILSLDSADMARCGGENVIMTDYISAKKKFSNAGEIPIDPCWSLAALLNLLPSEFTQKGKYSTTTYKIDIRKYKFTDNVDLHQIAYGSIKFDVDGQYSFKDMINTGEKENLVDACVQMIIKLKELNILYV
jgi:hypothetical protein